MKIQLPDLDFYIDGEYVVVQQGALYGDVAEVRLHRWQLAMIVAKMSAQPEGELHACPLLPATDVGDVVATGMLRKKDC